MLRTKLFRLLLALGALAASPCVAQKSDTLYTATHEELQVVKVVLAQQAAWNKGDLDGFLARFRDADDTVAVLGSRAHGLAEIRAAYRTNYPKPEAMGQIEYTDVQARELGAEYALATGRYHLERGKKFGGPADGTFTEVLQKTATGWLIIFSETT